MELQETLKNLAVVLLSFNAYTWLSLIGVFSLYINWRRTPHLKFPPGPKGVPFLGVLPFLSDHAGKSFKKWSAKYGPIMSVRLGTESIVVLNNFDSVNEAFVQRGRFFADRPWVQLFCNQTKQNGIVFKKYGQDFKVQKQFALKYLRENGFGKMNIKDIINDEGDRLVKNLEQLQQSEKQIDFQHTLCQATSNVIWKTVLGERFEYDDPRFNTLLRNLTLMFSDPQHATRQGLIFIWNFLAKVPYFSATMQAVDQRMLHVTGKMQKVIDEHKSKFDPVNIEDYIDAFLLKQQNGTKGFTDIQLMTMCRDFFVAGAESTATTLTWLFVLYLNYPEHHKIIEEEIKNVLGSAGTPTMAKRAEMPFTCAFIQEVMRYRTAIPLGVQHCTTEEVKLREYVIPKGTIVMPNLHGVNMDPKDWPEPERFDPYRHLDENGRFVHSKKVIPFSIGSRSCIGESMGRTEVFLIFVKILQNFKIRGAGGRPPALDKEVITSFVAPQECLVALTPRY